MPLTVKCVGCGHVLYDGAGLRFPDEVAFDHDGKCPGCGRKLGLVPSEVGVKPIKTPSVSAQA